jgi:hypothetical protein
MIACDTCMNAVVKGEFLPMNGRIPTCLAYPNGIPRDIIEGALHREVRPDQDNDFIYKSYRTLEKIKK